MTLVRAVLRLASLAATLGWMIDGLLRRLENGRPPQPFSSLVVVDAPIERVWEELADIPGQPRWMREMKSVEILTPGPVGVGTRGEATVRILGLATTDPVEITAFDPPTRFEIRHDGAFTGRGEIRLERGADGSTTIVRWDEWLQAPLMPYLFAVVAQPILGRIFQDDLLRLRDLVERPRLR